MVTAQQSDDAHRMPGHSSPSILVVDDEPESRMILRKMLGDLGYRVIERPDGSSALQTIRKNGKVDLVITDGRMPDMSGLELARTLRQEQPTVPIIMITAYCGLEDYFRSHGLGVFEYINKPVEKKELAVIVRAALHGINQRDAG